MVHFLLEFYLQLILIIKKPKDYAFNNISFKILITTSYLMEQVTY